MFLWIILLSISLVVLVAAAKRLTTAAERIAALLGTPGFVIGATVVAVGTSLPELATSILATLRGAGDVATATIVGSNVFNGTMVVGVSAFVARRLVLDGHHRMLLFAASAAAFLAAAGDGAITTIEGALLTAFGIAALVLLSRNGRHGVLERFRHHQGSLIRECAILLVMAVGLNIAAAAAVESVIGFANALAVAPALVAVIALAAGTSAPELLVSVVAARRRAFGISLGNVLGSNMVNATLVAGLPAFLGPLTVAPSVQGAGLLFFAATTVAIIFLSHFRRVTRTDAAALLLMYALFVFLVVATGSK